MTKDYLAGLLDAQRLVNYKIRGARLTEGEDLGTMDLDGSRVSHLFITSSKVSLFAAAANLIYARFHKVHFGQSTCFKEADLRHADFVGCTQTSEKIDFTGSNLYGTHFIECKMPLTEYRKGKVVTEDIIAYKICRVHNNYRCGLALVTLKIPRGAIVFSINGDKCRTNKAIVTEIITVRGGEKLDRAFSMHTHFSYYVGDEITIYNFNCEYNVECGEGIHFFMTSKEAFDYAGI